MTFFWTVLALGLAAVAATVAAVIWAETRRPRALCLMYHRLASRKDCERIEGSDRTYTAPVEEFEKQVLHLKKEGFHFLTADEANRLARGEFRIEGKGVVLTFDDGCESVYSEAMPVLQRQGVPATVFVTTDPSAYVFGYGQRRLNNEEIQALDAASIHCESHSVTHRPLMQLTDDEIRGELAASRSELQETLGREVKFLSAPGNWIDKRVVRIAKETGYEAIWSSEPGSVRRGSNPFGLPRMNVDGTMSLEDFAALLEPWGVAQRYLVYAAKSLPKKVVGPKLWYVLRRRLLPWIPGGYLSFARWRMIVSVPVVCVALIVLWKALI